ncbi:MAG: transglutaminase domain-containing protein [Ardenticatenaceae bacterium]|nr:transglutaminase domain-containing protein [Ardenticatenaceae bacterium]
MFNLKRLLITLLFLSLGTLFLIGNQQAAADTTAVNAITIEDINFEKGQLYGEYVKKYPSTVYRRGDSFDITLTLEGEPVFASVTVFAPANYNSVFDSISCEANSDGFASCNQGTKSANGYIEWLGWNRYRVTLLNPAVNDVLIGNYKVLVKVADATESEDQKDSLKDFSKKFAVIFNPFNPDDEVYHPSDLIRQAFAYSKASGASARDEYGVWFAAVDFKRPDGNWRTRAKQKTFTLRPYSPFIFDAMIAQLDVHALNSAKEAYGVLSTYVDNHLVDDGGSIQYDVKHLMPQGSRAQCASHANFLVSHLRSAGIPSIPIYIDIHSWGTKRWEFHTWVEAWMGSSWLAVDPFSHKNTPISQMTFGNSGPAYDEPNNDLIGYGPASWKFTNNNRINYQAIFDGRNPLMSGGPESFAATVVPNGLINLSRAYWPNGAHPDVRSVASTVDLAITTDQSSYAVGETAKISVTLTNLTDAPLNVPLNVMLEGDYLFTKSRADTSMIVHNANQIIPANGQLIVPVTTRVSESTRSDYTYRLVATADDQVVATTFEVAASVSVDVSLPSCITPNQPFQLPISITNVTLEDIEEPEIFLTFPSEYTVQESLPLAIGTLEVGETWSTSLTVTAAESGIAHLDLLVNTGSGSNTEIPLSIATMCPVFLPAIIN